MADLRWTLRALESLERHHGWLNARNPAAAEAFADEIHALCGLIAHFPLMGTKVRGRNLRMSISRHYRYRIVYRVNGDAVEVSDLLHPKQR